MSDTSATLTQAAMLVFRVPPEVIFGCLRAHRLQLKGLCGNRRQCKGIRTRRQQRKDLCGRHHRQRKDLHAQLRQSKDLCGHLHQRRHHHRPRIMMGMIMAAAIIG
ncbi:hypothetical protein V5799_022776 [Amblyomma americanum]|uniref:Uncharacterized protein n=1 Tax=Amblyomma americanum TaxID=6943 RepID=A0AAQ4D129_AMBAM